MYIIHKFSMIAYKTDILHFYFQLDINLNALFRYGLIDQSQTRHIEQDVFLKRFPQNHIKSLSES